MAALREVGKLLAYFKESFRIAVALGADPATTLGAAAGLNW